MMETKGALGFLGLTRWWREDLAQSDRDAIETCFRNIGVNPTYHLLESNIVDMGSTPSHFLASIAVMLVSRSNADIGIRVFSHAISFARDEGEEFSVYRMQIEAFYKRRAEPGFLDLTIAACYRQIALNRKKVQTATIQAAEAKNVQMSGRFPHAGYRQLAIIFEKEGKLTDAIELCRQAINEGWVGDYEKRLDRLIRKTNKKK